MTKTELYKKIASVDLPLETRYALIASLEIAQKLAESHSLSVDDYANFVSKYGTNTFEFLLELE